MIARTVRGAAAGLLLLALPGCRRGEEPRAPASPGPARRLVVAFPRGLASLSLTDPAHEQFSVAILRNVYETLVQTGADLSVRPGLAESWYSPDDLTWVFQLRPGVRFHDGRTLAAEQVVSSLERARQEDGNRTDLANVSDIHARGPREVVLRTRHRDEMLPARLTYLFISEDPPADGAPAPGTGPYRITSWSPDGRTVLAAFPGYWGGAPAIATVEFEPVPTGTERARRLEAGQAQLGTDVDPADLPRLEARGLRVVSRPGLRVVYLAADCAREVSPTVSPAGNPFRDRRVREALDLALDRAALVAGPLRGQAEATVQLATPGEIGFDGALKPGATDPGRARALLGQAGYAQGFSVDLELMDGTAEGVAGELVRQLDPVGVHLRPRPLPAREFLQKVSRRETSLYLMRWTNNSGSAYETFASLVHSARGDLGDINGGGYDNPALDGLIARYPALRATEERVRLLKQVTHIVAADRPVLPLYRQHDLIASAPTLDLGDDPTWPIRVATLRWAR